MTEESPKRRRWFQFRLRALLVAILVLSLPLSWFAWKMEEARRQRKAVAELRDHGGRVLYDWASHGRPVTSWPRTLLGDDYFDKVHYAELVGPQATDARLEHFVESLPDLQHVLLEGPQVTDAGLEHLQKLTDLEGLLLLTPHQVTDAGLEPFTDLTKLRRLSLWKCPVTPLGVRRLQALLPSCKIEY